ncbi:MAG: acyl--CoA ligase [Oscillospiraceae bacterium]|nr:acyl--CoA ligase [Oscillospiraceae bacterium]MBQ2383220.1 acyl--CoA ligase [Oscillospiraceae bacterium]
MELHALTGTPSIDKPWLKYYPSQLFDHLRVPECTLTQYLQFNAPDADQVAMHYYGTDITWKEVFTEADRLAKALRAVGFGEGDQIPAFLRSVPEFIPLLLAAEKIGASILVRDNEIHENADALRKSGARTMFAHTFLSQTEMEEYIRTTNVRRFVLIDPVGRCGREQMPHYVQKSLDANFAEPVAHGEHVMSWCEFQALGDAYEGPVAAPADIDRPLFRCYTSGSTGPSKQVIHSAHSMIGVLSQMNFYGEASFRPTWLVTILPPCLVAVVISMLLLPLASRKLLILDPWVDVMDLDLELMRYRPNNWPMIPMFIEMIIRSPRIPADYDLSHLMAAGAGAEAYNNTQMARAQKFFHDHNCMIPFTTGYGSSEAGSNVAFHVAPEYPQGNGNVGCPMPLTTVGIFKPGTTQEVGYNVEGEICVSGPGVMLGYDDPEATARALKVHEDGKLWLHMGDIGMMNEDGVLYTRGRGTNKRFGGGFLDILPMENRLADAHIDGIEDEFFVNIPDAEHEGYYEPYLYVVLRDGVTVEDVRAKVGEALEPHMVPTRIVQLPERPFWHFKTNRIGLTNEVLRSRACCGVN